MVFIYPRHLTVVLRGRTPIVRVSFAIKADSRTLNFQNLSRNFRMIGRFFVFAALVCSVLAFSNYKSALGVKDYKGTDGVCNCIYAYSSM